MSLLTQLKSWLALKNHFDEINWLMDFYCIEDTVALLKEYQFESQWLNKSLIGFQSGSAVTYQLVDQQIKRAKHLSLKQVFQM